MARSDCFRIGVNKYGESATYARFAFRAGEIVYVLQGDPASQRTRDSIEIGPGQHVEDAYALHINHSFSPNLQVRGRDMVALTNIAVGDELTFNYLHSESEIVAPFTCYETGFPVGSNERESPSPPLAPDSAS